MSGSRGRNILLSACIREEERKKYDDVLSKFDSFFKVRKNIIFERAQFNRRNQLESKSTKQFITALHSLAEYCEYRTVRDEMIADRLLALGTLPFQNVFRQTPTLPWRKPRNLSGRKKPFKNKRFYYRKI